MPCMYVCMYICVWVYWRDDNKFKYAYIFMYVCLIAIIIFVACSSDGMYVNIYDCFYVCIRWL
jgi:hypothetical protein